MTDSPELTDEQIRILATDEATHIADAPDYAVITVSQVVVATNILDLLPHPWTGDIAKKNGVLFGLAQALGFAVSVMQGLIQYVKPQTRIATATDTNLESIATDFLQLPSALFNRLQIFTSGSFEPETDAAYSARIRAEIIAPENTLDAITRVVNEYLTEYPDGSTSVTVFDYMSDPSLFTSLSVPRGQAIFVIEVVYPTRNEDANLFFLGQGDYIGQSTYVAGGQNLPAPYTPDALLSQAVDAVRGCGTKVYWLRSYTG